MYSSSRRQSTLDVPAKAWVPHEYFRNLAGNGVLCRLQPRWKPLSQTWRNWRIQFVRNKPRFSYNGSWKNTLISELVLVLGVTESHRYSICFKIFKLVTRSQVAFIYTNFHPVIPRYSATDNRLD